MAIDQFLDIEQVSASKYPKESSVISVFLRLKIKNKKKITIWGVHASEHKKSQNCLLSTRDTCEFFSTHAITASKEAF